MVGIAAVIAQQRRIIPAIVGDDIHVAIIVVIAGGHAPPGNGTHEIRTKRIRNFFELTFTQVAKHEQRFFVGHFAVIKLNVVEHGAIQLQNIGPAIVVIIDEFHRYPAQQHGFVADARAKRVIGESAILIVVIEPI